MSFYPKMPRWGIPLKKIWKHVLSGNLPPSSQVDFCQFFAEIKPAVRTRLDSIEDSKSFLQQVSGWGMHYILDEENYLVVSRDARLVQKIIKTDQLSSPHTAALGRLLGYPECCVLSIAQAGEAKIDDLANNYQPHHFEGDFSLIDISGYLKGIALISHVPCSNRCKPSLDIAYRVRAFIDKHKYIKGFSDWVTILRKHHFVAISNETSENPYKKLAEKPL